MTPRKNRKMLYKLQSLAELAESTFLQDAIAQAIAITLAGTPISVKLYRALEGMVFAELESGVDA